MLFDVLNWLNYESESEIHNRPLQNIAVSHFHVFQVHIKLLNITVCQLGIEIKTQCSVYLDRVHVTCMTFSISFEI